MAEETEITVKKSLKASKLLKFAMYNRLKRVTKLVCHLQLSIDYLEQGKIFAAV